jgi:hypothetical protein
MRPHRDVQGLLTLSIGGAFMLNFPMFLCSPVSGCRGFFVGSLCFQSLFDLT